MTTTETLIANGGREWTSPEGNQRIYFNNLPEMLGWERHRNSKGLVTRAYHPTLSLSNNKTLAVLAELDCAKFWYDVDVGAFEQRGLSDADFQTLIVVASSVAEAA